MSGVVKVEEEKQVLETVETPDGIVQVEQDYEKLASESDPSAAAGSLFALYGPHLFNLVSKLSNRQLKRLLKALVTWPLEDIEVNKKNEVEKAAYAIANKMIESRFLLTLSVAYEEEEKRKALTAQQKAEREALEKQTVEEAKVVSETISQGENTNG